VDANELENLLASMNRVGASALHLVPGRAPALRVQRRFVPGEGSPVQSSDVEELTRDMMFADHRERLARSGSTDLLYVARTGRRYRATIAQVTTGVSLVLRPLPESTPKLEDLDLPDHVAQFTRGRSGLVLVAGFFGSGKSTTLAALVGALNQDPARHIVTIEDSIEFVHGNGAALLHQREVGTHVASAVEGIRQAVAIGVDAIVVGEIRDAETLEAAITAAEAGCLVLGGVEAGSIVGAFTELLLMAETEDRARLRARLARSLRGAMAQSLLQRSHRAGRVAVVEILVGNLAARAAIRKGSLAELNSIMQRCRSLGMQTSDISLRGLLSRHLISPEEALLHANDRDELLGRGLVPTPVR
jgi:twitching motility protein PilT